MTIEVDRFVSAKRFAPVGAGPLVLIEDRMMVHATRLMIVCAGVLLLSSARADVWEYRRDGSVVFHQTLDYFQRQRMSSQWRPPSPEALQARRAAFDGLIRERSAEHGVDPDLVHAIIEMESGYDTSAVSKTGAVGLMQLMPTTAARFGVTDRTDPTQNVDAGVRYLKTLSDEFQDLELVLAAYNAGEDAVRHYDREVPPYAETRSYVDRLLELLDQRGQSISLTE
jgi:soluble lytic murein transglycosylase-like protein